MCKIYWYCRRPFLQVNKKQEFAPNFCWHIFKWSWDRKSDFMSIAGVAVITYWLGFGLFSVGLDEILY